MPPKERRPRREPGPSHQHTEALTGLSANGTEPVGGMQADESDPFGGASAARVIERYDYVDDNGEPLFQVRRWEPKRFTQHGWTGTRFGRKLNGVRPVLYHWPRLIDGADQENWIVEGERDVHSLEAIDEVATCNPGGAGKWRSEFNETFVDRSVSIIADWDPPGQAHALTIHDQLEDVAASVEILRAKTGKDVTDHLQAGYSLVDLVSVPATELRKLVKPKQRPATTHQRPKTDPVVPEVLYPIVGRLAKRGPVIAPTDPFGDWSVCCPVHDDHNPSATLRVGTERPIVFHCHRGCSQADFLAWAKSEGIPTADLMESKGPLPNQG
jgi:hypothetical protein